MKKSINKPPDVDQEARFLIQRLRAQADPVRALGTQQYFKNEIQALGIGAPAIRSLCKDRAKVLKESWTIEEAIALCGRLLDEAELEIRSAGILILSAFKKEFTPRLTQYAERWLRTRLDNWALVDSFCGCVLSPLLDQHPAFEATLKKWSRDSSLWVRRASIVALVPFARRGRFLDLAYSLAQQHFPDREDLMHKATGWLLREAGKTDSARLRDCLLQHGPAIPRTALRYAIEKFPKSERSHLLAATRPSSN